MAAQAASLVLTRETKIIESSSSYVAPSMKVLPAKVVATGTLASLGYSSAGTPLVVATESPAARRVAAASSPSVARLADPKSKSWYDLNRSPTQPITPKTAERSPISLVQRFHYRFISTNEPYTSTSPTMISPPRVNLHPDPLVKQYQTPPSRSLPQLHTEVFYDPSHIACEHPVVPHSVHLDSGIKYSV